MLGDTFVLSPWLRFSASAISLNQGSLALEYATLTPILTCQHKLKQDFEKLSKTLERKFKS